MVDKSASTSSWLSSSTPAKCLILGRGTACSGVIAGDALGIDLVIGAVAVKEGDEIEGDGDGGSGIALIVQPGGMGDDIGGGELPGHFGEVPEQALPGMQGGLVAAWFEATLALGDPAIKSGGPGEQARGSALVGGYGGGGEEEFEEEWGGDGVDYSTDVLYLGRGRE